MVVFWVGRFPRVHVPYNVSLVKKWWKTLLVLWHQQKATVLPLAPPPPAPQVYNTLGSLAIALVAVDEQQQQQHIAITVNHTAIMQADQQLLLIAI